MALVLKLSDEAKAELGRLEKADEKKLKKVRKTLALLETNPKHPGLHCHKLESVTGAGGRDVWEAYVENNTPSAYRVFFHYGPGKHEISVIDITPHPK